MKTKYLLPLLCLALYFFACNEVSDEIPEIILTECGDFSVEPGEITDLLAYEIIDVVVESEFGNKPFVHILRETNEYNLGFSIEEDLDYLSNVGEIIVESELLEAHYTKNAVVSSWNDGFARATLFAEAERECFYENIEIACDSYRAKYPDASGFINFSRPEVLNNFAVLEYVAHLCAGFRGNFVLLEKKNDVWVVINSFNYLNS